MAVALGVVLVLASFDLQAEKASTLDVLAWVFLALVASGAALWASAGQRASKAEPKLEEPNWSDRIAFEPQPAAKQQDSLTPPAQISGTS
jgi:hypothetical protein